MGKKRGAKPDINITPLVDVVLVLLIIFMVVTPQLEAGESVELPSILNVDPKSKNRMDTLTVTYTLSGRYFIEKDAFTDVAAFEKRLREEHDKSPNRRVMLKGDERQTYGKMRDVFALISRCGFTGVSLVVAQKGGES
jgi:biopolymer transport protein ExbD/biopolymer transport protein TolR